MKTIAFFNNKGGVGKTSLVYHLAWMYAELGLKVIAADLDPQANLTSMFVEEDRLEELWFERSHQLTVYGAMQPLLEGTGDIRNPHIERISGSIGLIVGDLALSASEDELTRQWSEALDRKPRAFRVLSAIWRLLECSAEELGASVALVDVGPNLGAINRATLVAAEHVIVPLASDLYSLQGLRNLGPTLRRWRDEWQERKNRNSVVDLSIPSGEMQPSGYVLMQHAVRLDRPVKAYDRWMSRIPDTYEIAVLARSPSGIVDVKNDANCLAALKHYRSLMPMAQEARKPMFFLKAADGALGAHGRAVQECYQDFNVLAKNIALRCGVSIPSSVRPI